MALIERVIAPLNTLLIWIMQNLRLLIDIQNKKDIALNLNANNSINQCGIVIHQIEDPIYLERIDSF